MLEWTNASHQIGVICKCLASQNVNLAAHREMGVRPLLRSAKPLTPQIRQLLSGGATKLINY